MSEFLDLGPRMFSLYGDYDVQSLAACALDEALQTKTLEAAANLESARGKCLPFDGIAGVQIEDDAVRFFNGTIAGTPSMHLEHTYLRQLNQCLGCAQRNIRFRFTRFLVDYINAAYIIGEHLILVLLEEARLAVAFRTPNQAKRTIRDVG